MKALVSIFTQLLKLETQELGSNMLEKEFTFWNVKSRRDVTTPYYFSVR